jgi:hypothetical protein
MEVNIEFCFHQSSSRTTCMRVIAPLRRKPKRHLVSMSQVKVKYLFGLGEGKISCFGIAEIIEGGDFDTTYKSRGHSQASSRNVLAGLGTTRIWCRFFCPLRGTVYTWPLKDEILFQVKFYFLSTGSIRCFVFNN